MAWRVKDEFLDIDQEIYHIVFVCDGAVTAAGQAKEFHRMVFLRRETCPHCGQAKEKTIASPAEVDIDKARKETHQMLEAHHAEMMALAQKHRARVLNAKGRR